jgi:hypothetical protein
MIAIMLVYTCFLGAQSECSERTFDVYMYGVRPFYHNKESHAIASNVERTTVRRLVTSISRLHAVRLTWPGDLTTQAERELN